MQPVERQHSKIQIHPQWLSYRTKGMHVQQFKCKLFQQITILLALSVCTCGVPCMWLHPNFTGLSHHSCICITLQVAYWHPPCDLLKPKQTNHDGPSRSRSHHSLLGQNSNTAPENIHGYFNQLQRKIIYGERDTGSTSQCNGQQHLFSSLRGWKWDMETKPRIAGCTQASWPARTWQTKIPLTMIIWMEGNPPCRICTLWPRPIV